VEEFIQFSQPYRRLRVPVDHGTPRVQKLRADGRRRPSPEIQPGAFRERGGGWAGFSGVTLGEAPLLEGTKRPRGGRLPFQAPVPSLRRSQPASQLLSRPGGGSGIVVPGEGVLHLSGQDLQGIGAGLPEAVQM
jgi:hypothetical protein